MNQAEFALLAPQGRLDALGAQSLRDDLEPLTLQHGARVMIDMTDARYISSDGLRVLMRANKAIKQNGGKLVLCCLSDRINEIVLMAGLDHVLEIYPTRGDAQQALTADSSTV